MQSNTISIRRQVADLISATKGVRMARLTVKSEFSKLGFDELDLVDVILEVEKKFKVIIPDEVPLHSIDDFVRFLSPQALKQAG